MKLEDGSFFPRDREPIVRRLASVIPAGRRKTRREEFRGLPARLASGERLGAFVIVREISAGSHASVFEARSLPENRGVALKVLSSHLSIQPEAVARFRAESALAERVSHPALIPVYGSGQDRGYSWYAMRLVRGSSLEEICGEGELRRDGEYFVDLAERFASVVRAVGDLHEAGVIHRDLKPSNILVDADGRYVLTDFGSALDRRDPLPGSGPGLEIGGTVLYMSPEQLTPGCDPRDPSGDIYSLGLTLYEASTGFLPFGDLPDDELARLKVTHRVPPPRRLNPDVPMAIDAVVRRATEQAPALRYAGAADMARDLERFARRKREISDRR